MSADKFVVGDEETCAIRLRGEVCPICDEVDRVSAEQWATDKAKRDAERAEKKRVAAASLRLELEKIETAICYDCEKSITGLDRQCFDQVTHLPVGKLAGKSGDELREVFWYHARCIGCDHPESVRQSADGCGVCAREWKDATDAT